MARKPSKRVRFLRQHPICCFCGGCTASEEIDHLPSRACFDRRNFPDGFEFPTCRECNASTQKDEQVVALLSRAHSHPEAKAISDEIGRYMSGVANNNPEVFDAMAREQARIDENHGVFRLGDATDKAFVRVLTRWAKAFHYRETAEIVPPHGRIFVTYFTNANAHLIPAGAMDGQVHKLTRNGQNIGDQFAYVTRTDRRYPDLGYYTAAFRRSFLALLMVDFYGKVIPDSHLT